MRLVLDYMPDEGLMRRLEKERGRGRDDYTVRAVWNSILAGLVFGHNSIESLRRELFRNAQMRQLCGFDAVRGADAIPPSWQTGRTQGGRWPQGRGCGGLIGRPDQREKDNIGRNPPWNALY